MIDDHRGVVDEVDGYQEEPRIAVVQEDKRNIGIDLNIKTIPRYPSNDQAGSWGGVEEVKLVSRRRSCRWRGRWRLSRRAEQTTIFDSYGILIHILVLNSIYHYNTILYNILQCFYKTRVCLKSQVSTSPEPSLT